MPDNLSFAIAACAFGIEENPVQRTARSHAQVKAVDAGGGNLAAFRNLVAFRLGSRFTNRFFESGAREFPGFPGHGRSFAVILYRMIQRRLIPQKSAGLNRRDQAAAHGVYLYSIVLYGFFVLSWAAVDGLQNGFRLRRLPKGEREFAFFPIASISNEPADDHHV
ncbi:MAG: hypothetical protein LBS49_07000 [Candidatus Accumulibacter sp.]|nr:hypothetical protein [Accumulibacter sp.]